ncbi:hypothetical protein CDAR_268491 [Caerostris darwini]|uniref:Uncharacterized protein n=1 Tax=Caerostris darwini TaxID=1538125 RepID=A0AAV4W0T4_9ARAC|nr:hypothetical protein CDAR_268491 [Caerostris darwini]
MLERDLLWGFSLGPPPHPRITGARYFFPRHRRDIKKTHRPIRWQATQPLLQTALSLNCWKKPPPLDGRPSFSGCKSFLLPTLLNLL